ncbi:cytochrome oxidase small assembly protein [Roseateles sp. DAIF2]|nr:cytochrome oxidase small assembly protein [Roseateles sp. DAIF2]
MHPNPQQRKSNRRLGLILASVAAMFAIGFMAKIALLGG